MSGALSSSSVDSIYYQNNETKQRRSLSKMEEEQKMWQAFLERLGKGGSGAQFPFAWVHAQMVIVV